MLREERLVKILDILNTKYSISCLFLSETFNVTKETIRSDLNFLDKKNLLKKTFGGAISLQKRMTDKLDPPINIRQSTNLEEKRSIALTACSLIKENSTIALDASTTTLQMVEHIPTDKNITVVTNSLSVLIELNKKEQGINIVSVGGVLRQTSTSFLGFLSISSLSQFNIDISFFSCNSIVIEKGLMDPAIEEVDFKRNLIEVSNENILLSDSSKFNKMSTYTVSPLSNFSTIISDKNLDEEIIKRISKMNIKLELI